MQQSENNNQLGDGGLWVLEIYGPRKRYLGDITKRDDKCHVYTKTIKLKYSATFNY